ncbi:DegT/DnrJ/EryC1/StrS family aminotransferase [Selenomonas montiformis]|uniref:DegT/DnrJ/EryC1/StrS family aminotransferase n=1 Tax=Selenomonas montiformis TaxID=2652285 RepID=UPI003F8A85A6
MKERNISFSPPDITDIEVEEVKNALLSGWITTGPRTKKLERAVAAFCHVKNAVCLNSATAALELTLRVLGVGKGDEVITSAYTYTASASVIDHVGAKIVLVDTAPNSYEMDYAQLSNKITDKTKVIIPVDIAGIMCDYQKILNIVKQKKGLYLAKNNIQSKLGRIAIVADSAHGFGAEYHGLKSGQLADFTTFSFHAVKNFTTAEGGAVVWQDIEGVDSDELYKEYQLLSLHGQSKDALAKTQIGSWEYDIKILGYKCNMTDVVAAIGLAQMKRYENLLSRRQKIIAMYDELLSEQRIQRLNHVDNNHRSSGHLYMIRLLGYTEDERNVVIKKMAEAGIATNVHYKPLPMHTAYKDKGFVIADYPNAYDMYKNEITLPLHTKMTDDDVLYVCETLKKILKEI